MDLRWIDAGPAQMYGNSEKKILLGRQRGRSPQRPPVVVVTQNLIESIVDRDGT